tara:strand:- start:6258 stop:6524 length:267 start_codon:yes stop_codon:yes gene_type:complete
VNLRYKDFVPKEKESGLFTRSFASLEETLEELNQWIWDRKVKVVNIETLVLPNIHAHYEEGREDTSLKTSGDMSARWYQVLRLWYKEG